jgi:putative tryptophan/tyrosine transport system substrate-binding protein
MKRREALAGLAGLCAIAFVPAARAQGAPFRIGFVFPADDEMRAVFVGAMKEHGWVEQRDFVIVQSPHPAGPAYVERAVQEMLTEKPDVLVTLGTARARVAHRLTSTIPIVMWTSGYPVEAGLAHSLARPGKNVTGNSIYAGEAMWGKMVELLCEAQPRTERIGVLWGYTGAAFAREEINPAFQELRRAAKARNRMLRIIEYEGPDRAYAALAQLWQEGSQALIIAGRSSMGGQRSRVMGLAIEKRLPTIVDTQWPLTDEPYPLMAYGGRFDVLMRQVAFYVDRIRRGARPGDLPIQLPAKFELVLSLRTARAIGLTLPAAFQFRPDRLIE